MLLEHPQGAGKPMAGFTDNYLRVEVDGALPEFDNTIVNVKITGVDPAAETMQGILFTGND